ncbi:uncharacterized protein ASPGLDRAFT_134216, partial [Aspergillus glaucus CBS 516.65]
MLTIDRFFLARLVLDEVLELTTIGQIRKTLQREPQGLQGAFDASVQRIDAQPKPRRSLARRLLSWITYAKRRLKIEEAMCAFAVDEERFDHEYIPSAALLLRVCVGLVV